MEKSISADGEATYGILVEVGKWQVERRGSSSLEHNLASPLTSKLAARAGCGFGVCCSVASLSNEIID